MKVQPKSTGHPTRTHFFHLPKSFEELGGKPFESHKSNSPNFVSIDFVRALFASSRPRQSSTESTSLPWSLGAACASRFPHEATGGPLLLFSSFKSHLDSILLFLSLTRSPLSILRTYSINYQSSSVANLKIFKDNSPITPN